MIFDEDEEKNPWNWTVIKFDIFNQQLIIIHYSNQNYQYIIMKINRIFLELVHRLIFPQNNFSTCWLLNGRRPDISNRFSNILNAIASNLVRHFDLEHLLFWCRQTWKTCSCWSRKKNKQKCIRSMLMLNMPTPYVIEITRIKRQNYSV